MNLDYKRITFILSGVSIFLVVFQLFLAMRSESYQVSNILYKPHSAKTAIDNTAQPSEFLPIKYRILKSLSFPEVLDKRLIIARMYYADYAVIDECGGRNDPSSCYLFITYDNDGNENFYPAGEIYERADIESIKFTRPDVIAFSGRDGDVCSSYEAEYEYDLNKQVLKEIRGTDTSDCP